ncbi:ATP-dependent DNA helicase Rep [compost metagenome]
MEEGTLPYQIAVDEGELPEERRLCYVAITRAKRFLQLSYVRERKRFGQKQTMTPSRFLSEMTAAQPPAP